MSSVQSDDDYDVISNPGSRSLDSSIADLSQGQLLSEPEPLQSALDKFDTVSLTPEDIQAYVQRALDTSPNTGTIKARNIGTYLQNRTVRVYVDGTFDWLGTRQVHQLRQAKLSFSSVFLVVGVFSDELCQTHHTAVAMPHVERCEILRHCRWVDQVLPDAPWQLDAKYLHRHRIDYVGLEEGTSVDPLCDNVRLKGYDEMKRLGKVIPLRRTTGAMHTGPPTPLPITIPLPLPIAPNATVVPSQTEAAKDIKPFDDPIVEPPVEDEEGERAAQNDLLEPPSEYSQPLAI
ncbi:hypothetical protein PC9H_006492 [Pleurotus ostreatus]|uniref:choline-phosphate cytidylyltransferase n=1 Tax=Pleurotus ostreatus TaxID=5322 RepID=A0A8H7A107_PLEOS|nr:uncharacterized protein PC9H_006492 [Pleurotus ostreatus]KAF7430781.1 hypothetical protein PC9H_006492 [Pleurotus ostreatus]KAJ8695134.1 hypothetical protein PTI98_007748 [Pleurotus ostreatus]